MALLIGVVGAFFIGFGYASRHGRGFLFLPAAPGKEPRLGWFMLVAGWFGLLEGVLTVTGLAAGVK